MYFTISLLWKQLVWGFSHPVSPLRPCSVRAQTWEAAIPQGGSTQPSASLVSEHPCLSLFCTGGSITHTRGPGHSWRHGITALLPRLAGEEPEAACRHSGAYWSLCLWSPSYGFPSMIFLRFPHSSESVPKHIIFFLDTFLPSASWFFINPQSHSASVWPFFSPVSLYLLLSILPDAASTLALWQTGQVFVPERCSLCPSPAPLVATQEDQSYKKLPLLDPVQPDVLLETASDSGRVILNLAEVGDHGREHMQRCPERCKVLGMLCVCADRSAELKIPPSSDTSGRHGALWAGLWPSRSCLTFLVQWLSGFHVVYQHFLQWILKEAITPFLRFIREVEMEKADMVQC